LARGIAKRMNTTLCITRGGVAYKFLETWHGISSKGALQLFHSREIIGDEQGPKKERSHNMPL
jgi:hypothetical protein